MHSNERLHETTYTPTPLEKLVISKANITFITRYMSGIGSGVVLSFLVMRRARIAWRSTKGLLTFTTLGVTGELLGRKWGEWSAKELLAQQLPEDAPLRHAIRQKLGIDLGPAGRLEPQVYRGTFLEAGSNDPAVFSDTPNALATSAAVGQSEAVSDRPADSKYRGPLPTRRGSALEQESYELQSAGEGTVVPPAGRPSSPKKYNQYGDEIL
ncbi:hypothetical protein HDU91_006508 [Kappamyces sp. JEL0680]|nr:hypothetical protein HDU91_006508 [Kappamyces sp. JEL0680]